MGLRRSGARAARISLNGGAEAQRRVCNSAPAYQLLPETKPPMLPSTARRCRLQRRVGRHVAQKWDEDPHLQPAGRQHAHSGGASQRLVLENQRQVNPFHDSVVIAHIHCPTVSLAVSASRAVVESQVGG